MHMDMLFQKIMLIVQLRLYLIKQISICMRIKAIEKAKFEAIV